ALARGHGAHRGRPAGKRAGPGADGAVAGAQLAPPPPPGRQRPRRAAPHRRQPAPLAPRPVDAADRRGRRGARPRRPDPRAGGRLRRPQRAPGRGAPPPLRRRGPARRLGHRRRRAGPPGGPGGRRRAGRAHRRGGRRAGRARRHEAPPRRRPAAHQLARLAAGHDRAAHPAARLRLPRRGRRGRRGAHPAGGGGHPLRCDLRPPAGHGRARGRRARRLSAVRRSAPGRAAAGPAGLAPPGPTIAPMASGTSTRLRRELVQALREQGHLRDDRVAAAFEAVPRELFLAEHAQRHGLAAVYRDEPIVTRRDAAGTPLSSSSQPAIMARMLEMLGVRPGQRVLEIGAGTGYNAALLAHLVGEEGTVVSVDVDADTAVAARRALLTAGAGARVEVGDGARGWPPGAPYDAVIATASTEAVPRAWFDQLRPGGTLVVPLRLST